MRQLDGAVGRDADRVVRLRRGAERELPGEHDRGPPGYEPRSYLYSYSGFGVVSVIAFRLRDATSGDRVGVAVPSGVGTYTIGQCGVLPTCPAVTGKLGMDFATENVNPDGVYFGLSEGTITLTRSDSARVEGRFSGKGVTQRLVDGQLVTTGQITIQDGHFSATPKPATWPAFQRTAPGLPVFPARRPAR